MTAAALRPMLATDADGLAAIFRASIAVLAAEDYDEAQCEAWASRAEDVAAFAQGLAKQLTLVATTDGAAVGFASLAGTDRIAMLYVAPDHIRRGIASLLLDALVRLAGARGATSITVDASDTARDFFAKRGFTPTMRNTMQVGDQWLGNTTMARKLEGAA